MEYLLLPTLFESKTRNLLEHLRTNVNVNTRIFLNIELVLGDFVLQSTNRPHNGLAY